MQYNTIQYDVTYRTYRIQCNNQKRAYNTKYKYNQNIIQHNKINANTAQQYNVLFYLTYKQIMQYKMFKIKKNIMQQNINQK
jgi:hypothetical protein